MVDTGATVVALNGREALRVGVDARGGRRVMMATANGVVPARAVRLDTVQIGSATLHDIEAVVRDGDSPGIVLLGMRALNRFDMKRDGSTLVLTRRY